MATLKTTVDVAATMAINGAAAAPVSYKWWGGSGMWVFVALARCCCFYLFASGAATLHPSAI